MTSRIDSREFYNTVARYYDAENEDFSEDLALYASLADETSDLDGAILDVGCGTGRVVFHLAMQGHQVAGLDFSEAMLDRAHRKLKGRVDLQEQITLYQGSALTFDLPGKYRLILIPYNTLTHFGTSQDQRAVLGRLAKILHDDGLLVIDLPNAGDTFSTLDDDAVTLERSFVEPESGNLVMQQSVSSINRVEQLQQITWIYDEISSDSIVRRTVAPLTVRYIFPVEMDLLLEVNGLRRVERYGDYDSSPFEDGCPRMIIVAAKA